MIDFPKLSSGSMKVYSPLSNSAIAMYPATLTNAFVTRVIKFLGDQEQRWVVRQALFNCTLQYHQVNGYDLAIIKNFFSATGGKYVSPDLSNTFSLSLNGEQYNYCVFDQDLFSAQVDGSETYTFSLMIKQVRPNI